MSRIAQLKQGLSLHSPRTLDMDFPEAGVLVPITDHPREPEIILTKRCDHLRTHGGQVAFPGGRRDPSDESLLHTALRESEEEIALKSGDVQILGALDQVASRFGILVTPYVGLVPTEVELVANPDELDALFRVPVDFFLRDERKRTDVIAFRGVTLHVPSWQYEIYEIWGLTAIILVNLLNTAFGANIQLTHYDRRSD